jgi:hypothetical protein
MPGTRIEVAAEGEQIKQVQIVEDHSSVLTVILCQAAFRDRFSGSAERAVSWPVRVPRKQAAVEVTQLNLIPLRVSLVTSALN